MLRKLLKYELRSIYQTMLPLYGAVLVAAVINLILNTQPLLESISDGTFRTILMVVYVALMIAMATICIITIIERFYKGLLSEEGYLMFTLPVKPWEHIASKMISASLLLITSGIVALITFLLIALGFGVNLPEFFSEVFDAFGSAIIAYHIQFFLYAAEFCLLVLVFVEKQILKIYASISIGHLFSKYRLPISFVAYVALGAVLSFFWGAIGNGLDLFGVKDPLVDLLSPESYPRALAVHNFFWIGIVWQGVECAVHWFITHTILSKHLNLE